MDRQLSHSSSVDEASEASVKSDGSRQGSFSAPPAETPKISCPAEERKGVWKQLKESVGSFVHSGARNEIGPGDKWQVRSPTNEKKVRRWSFDEVNGWYYQVDDGKKTFV